jgi:hypothetical protein
VKIRLSPATTAPAIAACLSERLVKPAQGTYATQGLDREPREGVDQLVFRPDAWNRLL